MSESSSLGSPASRAADSPMFGFHPNSPMMHSPQSQSGSIPIAHQTHQTQQPMAEYLTVGGRRICVLAYERSINLFYFLMAPMGLVVSRINFLKQIGGISFYIYF